MELKKIYILQDFFFIYLKKSLNPLSASTDVPNWFNDLQLD